MSWPTVPDTYNAATSLVTVSVHTEANDCLHLAYSGLRNSSNDLLLATTEFTNCNLTKLESAPNVVRLLLVETECPPKVSIYRHSAPKPKLKPKFSRPVVMKAVRVVWCIRYIIYCHILVAAAVWSRLVWLDTEVTECYRGRCDLCLSVWIIYAVFSASTS